jgi:hypothetical protein
MPPQVSNHVQSIGRASSPSHMQLFHIDIFRVAFEIHFERFCRVPVAVGKLLVEMRFSPENVRGGLFC